jgi:hypothetical protein
MRILILILAVFLVYGGPSAAEAQGCVSPGQLGYGWLTLNGYYRQAPTDCGIAADVNGHHTQGRKLDPKAGSRFDMPLLADNMDAASFLKKCLAENGIYSDEHGTETRHSNFETELARCNSELYGRAFRVKRIAFMAALNQMSQSYVNILNSALNNDGCIAIGEYKIHNPRNPFVLEGHAVEITGASTTQAGELSLDFADPNNPEATETMSTNYKAKQVDMTIADLYKKMMGYSKDTWIHLSGVTLKCPIETSCTIDWLNRDQQSAFEGCIN